jgi:hypothetical protein
MSIRATAIHSLKATSPGVAVCGFYIARFIAQQVTGDALSPALTRTALFLNCGWYWLLDQYFASEINSTVPCECFEVGHVEDRQAF